MLAASVSWADQEAGNRAYVQASDYGLFYARSIPEEQFGLKGKTQVFQVSPAADRLLYTLDWYSPELYLYGYIAGPITYVVRFGPWNRGHEANGQDLAVAFYKDGKLLKSHSTLDIVSDPNRVSASESHYTVFRKKLGFRRPWGNQIVFDVENNSGGVMTFNADTGEMMSKEQEAFGEQQYLILQRVEQFKWQWHEAQKSRISNIDDHEITNDELKALSPESYPQAPEGYVIVPHKMWTQAQLIKEHKEQ